MMKVRTTLIQKIPPYPEVKDYSKQLPTDNVFTYDVKNPHCTDMRRNQLLYFTIPADHRVKKKESENVDKYLFYAIEVKKR